MGQLGDGENPFPSIFLDLLLAHPTKEADVVLLNRLVVTTLAKLTDLAVVIQHQFGGRLGIDHLLDFSKKTFGIPQITVQSHLGRPALLAVPDDPTRRQMPLQPR